MSVWNRIPGKVRENVVDFELENEDQTVRPNERWQTDFTYLSVIGWGWFYLSTILDGYSRFIIAWKLCTTMKVQDVTDTLELTLDASGCIAATVVKKPRQVTHPMSRPSWPIILWVRASIMSVAHRFARKPKG